MSRLFQAWLLIVGGAVQGVSPSTEAQMPLQPVLVRTSVRHQLRLRSCFPSLMRIEQIAEKSS